MPDADPSVENLLDVAVAALGGVRRDGQHQMAVAVAETIDKGEHLLVQAGTGTGKSLGYLVPALRHAVLENEHVVVSTATLALQRQIITRDLPLVAKALAAAPAAHARASPCSRAGTTTSACTRSPAATPTTTPGTLFDLGDHAGRGGAPRTGAHRGVRRRRRASASRSLRLREWADETDTGDRDDLVPGRHATAPGGRCP